MGKEIYILYIYNICINILKNRKLKSKKYIYIVWVVNFASSTRYILYKTYVHFYIKYMFT